MKNKTEKTNQEKLIAFVLADIKNQGKSEDRRMYVQDIEQYGTNGGNVSCLIYHADCLSFLSKYREAINDFLGEAIDEYGTDTGICSILPKWDVMDPLALNFNVDLLARFGYEEAVNRILNTPELLAQLKIKSFDGI